MKIILYFLKYSLLKYIKFINIYMNDSLNIQIIKLIINYIFI